MRMLIAVDGSDHSHQAVQAVAHFRRAEDLALVHVLDVPVPAYPMMMPEVSDQLFLNMKQSMEEEGARVLRQMEASLPLDAGPCRPSLEVGKPAEVIVSLARDTGRDLIVMGARGMSPAKELLLGSVSHRVVTHAPCPVLVVNRPVRSCRTVLLAVEGDVDARHALSFLAASPFRVMPEVTCLTVLSFSPPPWPAGATVSAQMEREVKERGTWFVEDVAKKLREAGYQATPKVEIGIPSAVIAEAVAAIRPDLLVLGTHGREGVSRFVLGSVSHTALHRALCPVLIVR